MATNSKPLVFVIMPFQEDYLALYEKMKEDFSDSFEFINAGDLDNQQNILKDIVEGINQAAIVIADLTGLNPNVFYELGLAHAMNKKVIILTQDIDELPFDIKSYRAIPYSLLFHKLPALMAELGKLLNGAIDGSVKFGNPVSDYIPYFFNQSVPEPTADTSCDSSMLSPAHTTTPISDGESNETNGLLDFIVDISENAETITNEIHVIGDELSEMSEAVDTATSEINRVKSQSGTANVTFVRNICRKLAAPINKFSNKLKDRIGTISTAWDVVENSYLNLLDNPFAKSENNIDSIQESMEALSVMQGSINESNTSINYFINTLHSNLGIERRLNSAINLLIAQLQAYLSTTDTMMASVDRIILKSKVVFNELQEKDNE